MSTKRLLYITFYLVLISFFVALSCNEKSVTPQDDLYSSYTKAQRDSMTLASLKKVDDYPFYIMTFYGDYGFSNYVNPAANHSALKKKDILFDKFSQWANHSKTSNIQSIKISSGSKSKIVNLKSKIKMGCTCFAAMGNNNAAILGRNFDWYDHVPLLLFTNPPDGFASVSMVDLSYFGFTQHNLPDEAQNKQRLLDTPWLPFDGMNEMGVAVGMMAISQADSPSDPEKKTIGEIEVIRLVLDYAESTEQAIELITKYNVRMETPPIHYLIADLSGRSAIIEFVNGKMIVMRNTESWQVSTNFIIHGSGAPENVSCWRYNKVYQKLKEATGKLNKTEAMNLLQSVAQSNTIWSMIYQVNAGKINVAVGRKFNSIKSFELKPNEGVAK